MGQPKERRQQTPEERVIRLQRIVLILLALGLISVIASGNKAYEEVVLDREASDTLKLNIRVLENMLTHYTRQKVGPPEDVGGYHEYEDMRRRYRFRYGPEGWLRPTLRPSLKGLEGQ